MQPHSGISAELENKLLGTKTLFAPEPNPVEADLPAEMPIPPAVIKIETVPLPKKTKAPTVPVTFHLPIEMRDKIKLTAQAKQMTMLEIAIEALSAYLDRNQVSEADVRRMLGL